MIHAYDKIYLEKARVALGRMLDYAVNDLKYNLTHFFDLFISSGVASRFERGEFEILVGKSGIEIAYEVLEANCNSVQIKPNFSSDRSREYWLGWALAYYQWLNGLRFSEIIEYVPIEDILGLYIPYHEMDIRQFVDKMNELYNAAKPETNLKIRRQMIGLSQNELSERSGVPHRTIQQYEQRKKNINKAQTETLIKLSRALYCDVEDLIEKVDYNY